MTTSNNMLSVPLKKTDTIDLAEALKSVIDEQFFQPSATFEKSLNEINQLRKHISTNYTPSLDLLAHYKRYYVQLSSIELKFPPDSVVFPWYGTLGARINGPHTSNLFLYEKCNILFNIGAIYSQLAASQNRYTDEGLKKAGIYFQFSAGCFKTLEETLIPKLVYIPLELRSDTLLSLSHLCMAQVKEMYWFKSVKGNMKDTIVSRLSIQVSKSFNDSLNHANQTVCFTKDWINSLSIKSIHFEAAAYYRQSLICSNNEKFGEEISYLKKASEKLNTVRKITTNNEFVMNDFHHLNNTINDTLRKSERDNDLIYLQDVPPFEQLPQLQDAVNVDPLIPKELADPLEAIKDTSSFGSSLFENLVPFIVLQYGASFKERLDKYFTLNFKKPLDDMDTEDRNFLNESKIPYQIDSLLKPQTVPTLIFEHYEKLQSLNGLTAINNLVGELNSRRHESRVELDNTVNFLIKNKKDDENLISLYGRRRWNLSPFDEATSEISKKLEILENYLAQSDTGDKTIYLQIEQLTPYLRIYEDTNSIRDFLPNSEILELNPELKEVIFKLNQQISLLRRQEHRRKDFLDKLTSKMSDVNILQEMMIKFKSVSKTKMNSEIQESDFESLLQDEFSKFNKDIKFLTECKKTQNEIKSKINKLNVLFQQQKSQLKVSQEREDALRVLEETYQGYFEIKGNLKQGLGFYSDFLKSLNNTKNDLNELLDNRNVSKLELQQKLDAADRNL